MVCFRIGAIAQNQAEDYCAHDEQNPTTEIAEFIYRTCTYYRCNEKEYGNLYHKFTSNSFPSQQ